MMQRPSPIWVFHITRLEHVPSMMAHGIWSDTLASANGLTSIPIGHSHLKQQRAARTVPIPPGGFLSDYVPFYFAPRSPMLYAINKGRVAGYTDGCDRIVYLATTEAELRGRDLPVLGTDRHALAAYARFTADGTELRQLVDWPLMRSTYWHDVDEYPDRCERRQAELLVHRRVPWDSILFIATRSDEVAAEVRQIMGSGSPVPKVDVRPGWYF
ncbi:type II toxin-antitoxin system toxin DNA ADP-ribosyl transferase DarT [Nocardia xishanensis]|uniref:type II toxin-antitoxin system toxin DNA ADP-ribosyl transferase DarT n=1 Tax=Nocardia xishanensis TaxID=238964 RepID=UPI0008328F28|nr:DUF4433 domain-containing protein [Nocardia xishanensis]